MADVIIVIVMGFTVSETTVNYIRLAMGDTFGDFGDRCGVHIWKYPWW